MTNKPIELVVETIELGKISIYTNPKHPMAGSPFELTIKSNGFDFETEDKPTPFTTETEYEISYSKNPQSGKPSYSCEGDLDYIRNGLVLKHSPSCIKTKQLVEFPGTYLVRAYHFEVLKTGFLRQFKTDFELLTVYSPELFKDIPGAGGEGEPTYCYVMQDTKEGSKRVSNGTLTGKKGKNTFTRLPALAMAEYIRTSNERIKDPKDIEKRVIDNIPEWQKFKNKGQKPSTKYIKKEIRRGIKRATGKDVIPFNPIPFEIKFLSD